jgi:hypothetical protein
MKTLKKTSVNRLLIRFDNELKSLLVSDLNNVRSIKNQFLHSNHQARLQMR